MPRRVLCLLVLCALAAVALAAPRIVGGRPARLGQFPSVVYFQEPAPSTAVGAWEYCTGTLITPSVILSAAHCFSDYDPGVTGPTTIVAGRIEFANAEQGQTRTIKSVYVHQGYDDKTLVNDIALVVSSAPFTLNDNVQLVTINDDTSAAPVNYLSTAIGMGLIDSVNQVPSSFLSYAELPIGDRVECATELAAIGATLPSTALCAWSPEGIDTCQGDSGGPLMFRNVQIGLTSFGVGELCETADYAVFTDVAQFKEWIAATVAAAGVDSPGVSLQGLQFSSFNGATSLASLSAAALVAVVAAVLAVL